MPTLAECLLFWSKSMDSGFRKRLYKRVEEDEGYEKIDGDPRAPHQ